MMTAHRAWADINLQALQHNFQIARQASPEASVVAVIKANAYGHGMMAVASALHAVMAPQDIFGVACLQEAMDLSRLGIGRNILLLEGILDESELAPVLELGLQLVIHDAWQLTALRNFLAAHPQPADSLTIWLKLDTGMNRLGLKDDAGEVYTQLRALDAVGRIVIMTHLACADDMVSPATQKQILQLNRFLREQQLQPGVNCEVSMAASAAILAWPQAHYQWLRPGIMLYGGAAILGEDGTARQLKPVMTLKARLIAVKDVAAGSSIGYGATFISAGPGRIGVASIGYGDGYPRNVPTGAPVLVKCAASIVGGARRTRLVGRVSMDMITVDLSEMPDAAVGDEVTLWGEGLPADEIARLCGTISYELFCQVTSRVQFVYR